ncbi:phospholipase D-like domain-containing protein [Longimicrobium sp.]|uniref:phospholipase D-like domain-containing protein n=1 Tax=Longimicrobium sp. TaxID=2029185 RepID=UPI002E30C457|nr:phospholipase D-like domain-containing protein [Longimicrobium sp.]HEX6042421.1 phospholipase D-like domain-containing protein [Longimicrobium sp.]
MRETLSDTRPVAPADAPPAHPVARGLTTAGAMRVMMRMAERAMIRASDAHQVRGNTARLLASGTEAFRAWLTAIEHAERYVHLENYILRDDRIGRTFREALCERARAGVKVRVLYDWIGCWATPRRFWKPFRDAGVELRAFARPSLSDPLNLIRRDHRKVVAVDGGWASVSGMCIGDEWAGDPEAGIPAWRDTGVEFRGPVAAVIDRAFCKTWRVAGGRLPQDEIPDPAHVQPVGNVAVRVVEGEPGRSRIYRLSQFVAVGVERRLWITDPYFVLPPAMTEALASAARDGVDVRVLVPAYNNWPIVGGMSRAGYRPLLDAGVRLFEWEGPMIHAKTAVADGFWARVGSSNLNLASLLGNWELDVAVTDLNFAAEMEALFLRDIESSVEVTLVSSARVPGMGIRERRAVERVMAERPAQAQESATRVAAREARQRSFRGTEVSRYLGRLARAASVLARALVGQRTIGREDTGWVSVWGVILLAVAAVGFVFPRVAAFPLSLLALVLGIATFVRVVTRDRDGPEG